MKSNVLMKTLSITSIFLISVSTAGSTYALQVSAPRAGGAAISAPKGGSAPSGPSTGKVAQGSGGAKISASPGAKITVNPSGGNKATFSSEAKRNIAGPHAKQQVCTSSPEGGTVCRLQ